MKSKIALAVAAAAMAGALVLAMGGAAQADPLPKPGTCKKEKVRDPILGTVIRCIHPSSARWHKIQYRNDDGEQYDPRTYDPNYRDRQQREREERREQRRQRSDDDGERYRLPSPESMDCDEYGNCGGTYRAPHPDSARP